MGVPKALAEVAARLASEINADAILALTETGKNCDPLFRNPPIGRSPGKKIKLVLATTSHKTYQKFSTNPAVRPIKLAARAQGRFGQANHAMACGLQKGIFRPGDRLVCLVGDGFADNVDALMVLRVSGYEPAMENVESDPILAAAVEIALELGRGRPDGKSVGTAFVIGSNKAVLRRSYQLMINPFRGYSVNIKDRRQWGLIKKYATFDGAFVVGDDGLILAAERYLNANVKVDIPRGLGTRHLAVAAMTAATRAKGVTVSGEDGAVRLFNRGKLVARIDPHSEVLERLREVSGPSDVKDFRPKD